MSKIASIDKSSRVPRGDNRESIRYTIYNAAVALLCDSFLNEKVKCFLQPFKDLEDSRQASLLPNAIKEGMNAAFNGTELRVLTEVKFKTKVGVIPKRIDMIVFSKENTTHHRCVAIEIKATMEFNPLAAALMEFALLTEQDKIIIIPKGKETQLSFLRESIMCLTVSCYDNQDIARLLPELNRQLWPNGAVSVKHHSLFKKNGDHISPTLGIAELIEDIQKWCCSTDQT